MMEKLRGVINEARLKSSSLNSVPAIAQIMLGKSFQRKLAGVRGLRMHLMSIGLNTEIRAYLKRNPDEGDGITQDQLGFWPGSLRPIIKEIDRARVFVPSRGEFVMLDPKAINSQEVKEAGEYLVAKGEDCIRVGELLKDLAKRMSK